MLSLLTNIRCLILYGCSCITALAYALFFTLCKCVLPIHFTNPFIAIIPAIYVSV